MPRRVLGLLAVTAVLPACTPELPSAPTSSPTAARLLSAPAPGQGQCGGVTAPFTAANGETLGWLSTWWDDYNLRFDFQAAPGVGLTRTSLGYVELPDLEFGIPRTPDGLVDFERMQAQGRFHPPVTKAEYLVPMDWVNEELMEYAAVPRAVFRSANGATQSAWAGEQFGPWVDTAARHVPVYMIPDCGRRITVLTDHNMLDNQGHLGNAIFADNLLWKWEDKRASRFTQLPRHSPWNWNPMPVAFDRGRASPCRQDGSCADTALVALRTHYESVTGTPVTELNSREGTLTSIPANIGLLLLWLPRERFTAIEINVLKQFAAEGGRIVYVAEESGYYDRRGRNTLDHFLADMGSNATSITGAFDCGDYQDILIAGVVPHRLTSAGGFAEEGESPLGSVRVRCTGALQPDRRDFILFRDSSRRHVTAASVAISTVPIAEP